MKWRWYLGLDVRQRSGGVHHQAHALGVVMLFVERVQRLKMVGVEG